MSEWIPLKTRPMTKDEKEHYINMGRSEIIADFGEILTCPLPDDGQEVLISQGGIVCIDTFYQDDDCYFENADINDVDAWQPLPEPYEEGEK